MPNSHIVKIGVLMQFDKEVVLAIRTKGKLDHVCYDPAATFTFIWVGYA